MFDVTIFHSLQALAPWREKLAELHRASARRSPFSTLEFLEAYLAHDEFLREGSDLEVWFLVAFDRTEPVGYLPLRLVTERVGPFGAPRLEFLATHDVERPHPVCRQRDEAACVEAFYRALLARKREWSMLELRQQDRRSPLRPPDGVDLRSHYSRTFPAMTVNVIPNRWTDLQGYLGAMEKKFRANVRRQLRHLLAAGDVRHVSSRDPAATPALFDLYLEVERRSWKTRVGGTLTRDPRRTAFYRALLDARMPFRMGVGLVLLDGLPIAGSISNSHAGETLLHQVVFDDRFASLDPGNLLFALTMREAIEDGNRALNLMSGFSYYKTRWLAEPVECESLQLFRLGSLLFYKALLGELRRKIEDRLFGLPPPETTNVAKHEAEAQAGAEAASPDELRVIDRRLAAAAAEALAHLPVRTTTAVDLDRLFGLGLAAERAHPHPQPGPSAGAVH